MAENSRESKMPEKTGIEDHYAIKNGRKLQLGFTTGTCAAAATKAAALMLVSGKVIQRVHIMTPKGIALNLEVLEPEIKSNEASCAIRKISGDDPDVTDGVLVYSKVTRQKEAGIRVDGGLGVGRVTKAGLKQKIGEAAINPVPMEMIKAAAAEALADCGLAEGLKVVISIPQGVELAKKTFNPRLGIKGGISVLGTSGIVEPMSEQALIDCIELEIKQKHANGQRRIIMVPGNYGADFIKELCGVQDEQIIKCSNFIGISLDMAAAEGVEELLLVGNIGKLIKLAGGIMNTHSKEADARAELMAASAIRAGCKLETARAILDCLTSEEMLSLLEESDMLEKTMQIVAEKIDFYVGSRVKSEMKVSVLVFSNTYGILCSTGHAMEWIKEFKESTERES